MQSQKGLKYFLSEPTLLKSSPSLTQTGGLLRKAQAHLEKFETMAPKRNVTGLQRVGGEWVHYSLCFASLLANWSEVEASQCPQPWLDDTAPLHALRRMAIMADAAAVRVLLSLEGSDATKNQQILDRNGQDVAATRAREAAQSAAAYLAENPPAPPEIRQPRVVSDSSEDES